MRSLHDKFVPLRISAGAAQKEDWVRTLNELPTEKRKFLLRNWQ